jgi:NAD(P)-dependent dehydrogenase (short-subunit alcohol dehydrogenase family)
VPAQRELIPAPASRPRPARAALITGAASGIGAAVARALADPGMGLALATRTNQAGCDATAAAARAAGATTLALTGDLADPATAPALVAATIARFGRLDVLISNAGAADRTPLADLSDAALAHALQSTIGAFARLVRAVLPHLRTGDHPRIVAVSSFTAHAARADLPRFAATAAAKAGLEALVRTLACDCAADGIAVNAVVPGFIAKDAGAAAALDPAARARQVAAIPAGRLGRPEEVAAAIAFLAAPATTGITGVLLAVDGGLLL